MNEKLKMEPLKPAPTILRVMSHESILKRTKSFAEEVADALCSRAAIIGNSHPSVVIGKQRRIIEDLMHVAEAVRTANKDVKQESKTEIDISDNSKTGDIPPRVPPRICKKPTKELKTILKKPKQAFPCLPVPLKVNNNSAESSEIIDGGVFKMDAYRSVIPETSKECMAIHTRLTIDNNEMNDVWNDTVVNEAGHSVTKSRVPSRKSSQYVPLDNREHQISNSGVTQKRRVPIKLLSKKRREALRGYVQSKLRSRSRSESRSSWGRIGSYFNRNRVKTVRKHLQGAFNSSIQSAEGTFNRIKANVMASVKNEKTQVQVQQT